MRLYTVHCRQGSREPDREAVLVKEGFCWPAFLFAPLWAAWRRLWLVLALVLAAALILEIGIDMSGADPLTAMAGGLGLSAYIGFSANDWRRASLRRRGYRLEGLAAASDEDAAMRRFFDLHPDLEGPPSGAALGGL